MRVTLDDGRVFEHQVERLNFSEWGAETISKTSAVWRRINPNGTTQSVLAKLETVDGARYLLIDGESPARIADIT